MPESDQPAHLPFQFTGGFGLATKTIGGILASQGLIQVVATLFIFPPINRWLGSLTLFRLTIITYPLLYLVVPYVTLVPRNLRMVCVYVILVWKVTAQAFTFPSTQIMLANSAPSTKVLGTLNGAAASSASLSRSFGPTFSGLLQTAGLANGVLGLPWWVSALIASMGVAISFFMVEDRPRKCESGKATPGDGARLAVAPNTAEDAADSEPLVVSSSTRAPSETLHPTSDSSSPTPVANKSANQRDNIP